MFWATAKDELLQVERSDAEEPAAMEPDEMEEGGFSSVESMLQWAIGESSVALPSRSSWNSDPAKLREAAQDVKHLPSSEIKKRQAELQDLMEKLKMPSDADLMKVAIADLNDSSLSFDERYRALNELLILVEPIDNANGIAYRISVRPTYTPYRNSPSAIASYRLSSPVAAAVAVPPCHRLSPLPSSPDS
ncbi:hypothetical protein EJ110_NYTH32499 [Nymphaea thermarum]|nr:hypothetical protein EJ110_NYTH32499 [Nymphaea thermarum]